MTSRPPLRQRATPRVTPSEWRLARGRSWTAVASRSGVTSLPASSCNTSLDFHALRHTFLTNLARSGVHPKVAQALARHSTITLTMDRYTHTVLEDQVKALAKLPDLGMSDVESAKATGTAGPEKASDCLAECLAFEGRFHETSVDSESPESAMKGEPRNATERGKGARTHPFRRDRGRKPLEAAPGLEPGNEGFANPCLTTWLRRLVRCVEAR
jgi:hypothetical protein